MHQKSRTSTSLLAQAAVTPFSTRTHQPNESRTSPVPGQWTWIQCATSDSGRGECRTFSYLLYWKFRRRLSAHWQWSVGVTKWTGKHIKNISELYEALSFYLSVNSATKNVHVSEEFWAHYFRRSHKLNRYSYLLLSVTESILRKNDTWSPLENLLMVCKSNTTQ